MLQHLGLLAVCACVGVSVGCDSKTSPGPIPHATLEFSGRLINSDTEAPVGNVRVSVVQYKLSPQSTAGPTPTNTATSTGDGTFTLSVTLQAAWSEVFLRLSGPGYDDRSWTVVPNTAGTRAEILMNPTLVITPGESIEVRVGEERVGGVRVLCGFDGYPCRPVRVAEPFSDYPVELEVVSNDSSKPMALGLAVQGNAFILEPDMSATRLTVPPNTGAYVIGAGTARLTARR